jgi:hypothetical protein
VLTPLSLGLRSLIVDYMGENCGQLPLANQLLSMYDLEEDPRLKVQAVSYY